MQHRQTIVWWLTRRASPCRGPIAGELGRRWLTTILTTTVTTVAPPNTAPTARNPSYRAWSRLPLVPGSVGVPVLVPLIMGDIARLAPGCGQPHTADAPEGNRGAKMGRRQTVGPGTPDRPSLGVQTGLTS